MALEVAERVAHRLVVRTPDAPRERDRRRSRSSTLTLLGAENVTSKPGTRSGRRASSSPVTGDRAWSDAMELVVVDRAGDAQHRARARPIHSPAASGPPR